MSGTDAASSIPTWPRRPGPVLDWLAREGRHLRDIELLLDGLCRRLHADGMPLARATFHLRALHPEVAGERHLWQGGHIVDRATIGHEALGQDNYLRSPVRLLWEGADGIRQRLDLGNRDFAFPILDELAAAGMTDYVALPIRLGDRSIHVATFAADRPGGFSTEELVEIDDLLPFLAGLLEVHMLRRLGSTLLSTYVGHRAGVRILAGQIRRGGGETIAAAIWYADLRGFTEMSERLDRDRLIATLNAWFDAMIGPIERHGGETLKLIGDAVLAVFPLQEPDACRRGLRAADAARVAMAELNELRIARSEEVLDYGIALHVGDVLYGNIGAATRLDFTVIGPAVNIATRIEGLSRRLGEHVLLSAAFAGQCDCPLPSLGRHELRGSARPIEIFALPEPAPCI